MSKVFFTDWQLWEKLVFVRAFRNFRSCLGHVGANYSLQVLACAIVFTVFLGCAKLLYTHRRLRKCAVAAEQERQKSALQMEMSRRRRDSAANGSGSDNVPYGIRAIERGVEVEGVWISRSNSREGSRDTSASSSLWEREPKKDFNTDLERQNFRTRSSSTTSAATARAEHSSFDRAVSAEKLSSNVASRSSSRDPPITKPARPKYPPVSYNRYNGNPYLFRRQSNTTTTLLALESIYNASTSVHGDGTFSSDSSFQTSSTDDTGPISSSAPSLLSYEPRPRPRHQSLSDLELLNKHRTSQVAEQGQLTPRGRPSKALSMDFHGSAQSRRDSISLERHDLVSTALRTLSSIQATASPPSPCSSPKIDALPETVRRSSMPDVTPFTEFCKRASSNARPESLRSQSRDSTPPTPAKSAPQSPQESAPSSPIMPASEGAAEMKLPPPVLFRTSFEHDKNSQVIRGHGTGFEILRPGSLKTKQQTIEQHKTIPPVSLQNSKPSHRSSTYSTEPFKKLRKNRHSLDSTASSDRSRFSRISLFS